MVGLHDKSFNPTGKQVDEIILKIGCTFAIHVSSLFHH